MNKISSFKIIVYLLLFLALVYLRWSQQILSIIQAESLNSNAHFYGKKLADNYYTYSILDFHRLEVQRRPLILFFYSTSCASCQTQENLLVKGSKRSKPRIPVILRVNTDIDASEAERELSRSYRVSATPTILALDSDTNAVQRYMDLADEQMLQKMFTEIW